MSGHIVPFPAPTGSILLVTSVVNSGQLPESLAGPVVVAVGGGGHGMRPDVRLGPPDQLGKREEHVDHDDRDKDGEG